jgi:translation elongation factor P/translation initiation factor 5A
MSSNDLISKIDELILQIKDFQKERISKDRSNRMKSKILADSTVRKAIELVRKNQVLKIDEKIFSVSGSSDSQYHVMKSEKYELVCVNINQKSICTGWKFKKNCKHCESVRIFCKNNSN